ASWPAMANLAPLLSSASEHWLTPPAFLDLVRRVFGGVIDLDPATNRWSQVAASKNCINGEIDGLSIPWRGNVYCNPPYGDAIVAFTNRMRQLAGELRTCSLIALLPARIDTAWCQDDVIASADAWCDWRGRITFWQPGDSGAYDKGGNKLRDPLRRHDEVGPCLDRNGRPMPAPFPSLVPYWGDDVRAFANVFGPYGPITVRRGPHAGVYTRHPRAYLQLDDCSPVAA